MPRIDKYYRIRVRSAANTADALVISSAPSATSPYILEAPNGDGSSHDPLKGSVTTGSYTVRVIDHLTAANTRVVTAQLADANARQQLLSRVAIVEQSADAATWTSLQHGYVNAVRLIGGLVYEFAIGDTQRKEVSTDVFKYATTRLSGTTAIIGGPIFGGFGSIRDYGGWRFKVSQVNATYNYIQLKLIAGFDPRKINGGGNKYRFTRTNDAIVDYTNAVARASFEDSVTWAGARIMGYFPGLQVRVQETNGTLVGFFTPLAEPAPLTVGYWFGKGIQIDRLTRAGESSLWLDKNGLGPDGVTPLVWAPTVGVQYNVYVYIKEISKDNPLHYAGHPVDLWELIRLDAGIAYDATVLPAVRAAVGNDIRVQLRITQSYKIGAFDQQVIYGPFGLGTRMVNGARQLFSSRRKSATVPSATLALADLREPGKPFELDEGTAIKRVVLKQQRMVPWTTEEKDQPEADAIFSFPSTISIDNADTDNTVTGAGEVVYDIPGEITSFRGGLRKGNATVKWLAGVADEVFDRWGRGIIGGEFQCLAGVTALIGQELLANLIHMPVAIIGQSPVSRRAGARIIQIVGRTETPSGPNIKWLDAGSATVASVVPTFTLAANATDGRKYVNVTITNGAAITAIGGRIRVWVATGAAPASGSGTLAALINPATDALTFTLPGFDAGTEVSVQLQTVITDGRPSALAAFQVVDLTDLAAPTSLAVSAQDAADPAKRTLTWVVGVADIPVEVALRLTSESASANRVIAVLPPGSTRYELTGLDAANRTASVRHIESPPYAGASSYATVAVNTTGAARVLNPPSDPRGFSLADGTYGMDVLATEIPSEVEFQVAVGAGAFETAAILTSVSGGRTVFSDAGAADGVTRTMRARHTAVGYTESNWTASVTAVPWADDPLEDCHLEAVTSAGELVWSGGDIVYICT